MLHLFAESDRIVLYVPHVKDRVQLRANAYIANQHVRNCYHTPYHTLTEAVEHLINTVGVGPSHIKTYDSYFDFITHNEPLEVIQ